VAAPATVPLVNGIVTAGQYIVDRKIHNDPVDWRKTADIENVAANFAVGALVSPIAGTFSSNFIRSGGRQFLIEFGEQTFTQSSRRFAQEFIEEQAIEVIKTGVRSYLSNAASNLVNKGLNWIIERTDRKNESWLEYK